MNFSELTLLCRSTEGMILLVKGCQHRQSVFIKPLVSFECIAHDRSWWSSSNSY